MSIPPEILDRYLKVAKLRREGGTPGECAAAQQVCARMEAKYPGIAREASGRVNAPSGFDPGGFDPGPGPFTGRAPGAGAGADPLGPDWRDLFNRAQEFFHGARESMEADAAQHAAEIDYVVSEYVGLTSRIRPDGKIVFSVTVAAGDVADVLSAATDLGIEAISRRVGEDVAAEFAGLLAELCAVKPRTRRR